MGRISHGTAGLIVALMLAAVVQAGVWNRDAVYAQHVLELN